MVSVHCREAAAAQRVPGGRFLAARRRGILSDVRGTKSSSEGRVMRTRTLAAVLSLAGVAGIYSQQRAPAGEIDRYRPYYRSDDRAPKDGAVTVTFLGTTTLLFDDGETQVLIDGFFSRPSLLTVARGKIETDTKVADAAMKRAGIDRLKAVFVAHSHYDHALDVAYVARKTKAKLYGSASTLNVGRGGEVGEEQLALFEPKKEVTVGRFTVVVLESKHTPALKGVNDDLGEVIDKPLKQPAAARDYKEGGSFDFLVKHGKLVALVKPSTNHVVGALDEVRADVLFLGTATLGVQSDEFRKTYYEQTVSKVRPKLVIPIHWDNFFTPLDDRLDAPARPLDDLPTAFDFLIDRLKADKIKFGILQGYQSVSLPEKREK
jgi:L-ascorbate metabolism protein UlaG (beta-lactamase superfamily)